MDLSSSAPSARSCARDGRSAGNRATMNEHHPSRLSAIDLLSARHLTAFAVEDAQPDRSGWPRNICGGDDCGRNIRHLNLHFRQNRWSAIGRRASKLDSKPIQLRIEDALQFVRRRKPRKKSWLTRRSRLAIGNEDGIHRHSDRGVYVEFGCSFCGRPPTRFGPNLSPSRRNWLHAPFGAPRNMRQRQSR